MPTYLVTYHGGPGMPSDPGAAQQMLAAFQAWVAEVGSAMRDPGAPLGAAGLVRSHPFLKRGGSLQVSEAVSVGG